MGAFLGHLEDVLVGGLLLAGQLHVFLFQALGLFAHLFHLFAEGEEQVIAVVEGVFDLLMRSVSEMALPKLESGEEIVRMGESGCTLGSRDGRGLSFRDGRGLFE